MCGRQTPVKDRMLLILNDPATVRKSEEEEKERERNKKLRETKRRFSETQHCKHKIWAKNKIE